MKRIAILVSVVALAVGSVLGFALASGSSAAQTQKTYGPGWVNWAHVGPTQPIGQALSGIESNVGAVYYLNPETGTFLVYVPSRPEVSDLTTMDFGQSYLMLLTAPTAMTIPTEATFLATPTACPAITPRPTPTPCPACPTPENVMDEWCSWERASLELWRIVLDVETALDMDTSNAHEAISANETFIGQSCQGLGFDVIPSSGMSVVCWGGGGWEGRYSMTLILADFLSPSEEQALDEAVDSLDTWGDKYCGP